MLKIRKSYFKIISVVFILCSFICCLSANEITLSENAKRSESENELSLSYYNKYFSMLENNESQAKIDELLKNWKNEALSGDYYFCSFDNAVKCYVELKDNKAIVPEGVPNIVDGDYYIFKDSTIYWNGLLKGIDELVEGTHFFANRLDLWQNLMNILGKTFCYRDLKDVVLQYLDVISLMQKQNVQWIYLHDQLLKDMEGYVSDDDFLFNVLIKYSYPIIDGFQVEKSVDYFEEIYRKAIEVFPKEPRAYNELGYAIGTRNPKEALKYFEKAYKFNKENKNYILNCGIYSHLIKDNRKDKKYRNEIYNTKDENLIKTYEENIKYIDDNQNKFN